MKLPRSILIKGSNWKVRRRKHLDLDGQECYGLCDYSERTIWVQSGLDKELETLVFIHELIHASVHELHLDLDGVTDEILADGLSAILVSLFKINIHK